MILVVSNENVISLDNSSFIKEEISNLFCRMNTKAGDSKRELYQDKKEVFIILNNAVIINSIDNPIWKDDLLERSILLEMPNINLYNTNLNSLFEEKRSYLFDYVLKLRLKCYDQLEIEKTKSIKCNKHRMAEYVQIGEIVAQSNGEKPGYFLNIYEENRKKVLMSSVDNFPVCIALDDLLEKDKKNKLKKILLKELYSDLEKYKKEYNSQNWPKDPRYLSSILKISRKALNELGIKITRLKREKKGIPLKIERIEK